METNHVYQKENPDSKEEYLEVELFSSLEEIDKIRKRTIKLKNQLQKHEKKVHDLEEIETIIIYLKLHL
jgi:hypothetical protein